MRTQAAVQSATARAQTAVQQQKHKQQCNSKSTSSSATAKAQAAVQQQEHKRQQEGHTHLLRSCQVNQVQLARKLLVGLVVDLLDVDEKNAVGARRMLVHVCRGGGGGSGGSYGSGGGGGGSGESGGGGGGSGGGGMGSGGGGGGLWMAL